MMSEVYLLLAVSVLTGFMVYVLILKVDDLRNRTVAVTRVERKIDLLLQEAGIGFDAYSYVQTSIKRAIGSGNSILAEKLYRDASGASFADAKSFIEELSRRERQPV